jgi:hypothetical protein
MRGTVVAKLAPQTHALSKPVIDATPVRIAIFHDSLLAC